MDLYRLILYINILGICLTAALTYIMIVNLILGLPIQPVSICILAFSYVVMIKHNMVFRELWEKWTKRD